MPVHAHEQFGASLAKLTTLRLGGLARRLVEATTDDQIIETLAAADAADGPVLVLGGGSNVVIADAGFDGTVIRILTRGIYASSNTSLTEMGHVRLSVAAGEPWDSVIGHAVGDGLAGIECLAGIPGSAGATPIQNVGAYGQRVSDAIRTVRVYDRKTARVLELAGSDCGFAYRSSMLGRSARFAVLGVTLDLERSSLARPIRYPEFARSLDVEVGARPPLDEVREAVIELRRRKGMVLDSRDPDSVSAGSFFLNPVLSVERFAALERRTTERLGEAVRLPAWPQAGGGIKTSAAWLIEHSGFHRGFGVGRVGISTKHTLALVDRGGASTSELVALARELRSGVRAAFGVTLHAEPTLIGVEL